MATNEYAGNRLQHLKGSNYEIVDGEPDIRGWDVKDAAGKEIGEVKDLIFDPQARKVRYMVVDLDKDYTSNNKSRDVLIPIGLAELHKSDDDVILPGVTAEQFSALPEYKGDDISSSGEATIRNVFAPLGTAAGLGAATLNTATDTDFYNHEHFNEDNLMKNRRAGTEVEEGSTIPIIEEQLQVGKRTVETGGAYIRSRIVEKPVEESVNLQEERVYVERTPVDRPAVSTDFDTFKEEVVELKEHTEVPVVNKEARVVEEISIGKDVEERKETISDTVRKTEVNVENLDTKSTTGSRSSDDL